MVVELRQKFRMLEQNRQQPLAQPRRAPAVRQRAAAGRGVRDIFAPRFSPSGDIFAIVASRSIVISRNTPSGIVRDVGQRQVRQACLTVERIQIQTSCPSPGTDTPPR